jgi:hypothetical protein
LNSSDRICQNELLQSQETKDLDAKRGKSVTRKIKGGIVMESIIQDYMEQAKIGRKQSSKNLAIFPLLSNDRLDLEYLLLDEALAEGMIEVAEVSEGWSVPELKVFNKSPLMILILDGEELVGAKQNRIINTTILIGGKSTIKGLYAVSAILAATPGRAGTHLFSFLLKKLNNKEHGCRPEFPILLFPEPAGPGTGLPVTRATL